MTDDLEERIERSREHHAKAAAEKYPGDEHSQSQYVEDVLAIQFAPELLARAQPTAAKPTLGSDARRRPRGNPGDKRKRVMEEMRKMSRAKLVAMFDAEMVAEFSKRLGESVGRDTCKRARDKVLETL